MVGDGVLGSPVNTADPSGSAINQLDNEWSQYQRYDRNQFQQDVQ